ncbi:Protein of unknown function [Chitinophaga costaii]|uniref:DUF445 domain-containing protein n=1 Tax=Chitinophaga costaii TaxID=1335309 RepID=A0A1C4EQ70_9BACT|nr:DUF445 family protein [Chitinophaga costaii]PUZ22513.1 DUF445 domain-containing protein [Chitinophaga costaii]SCC45736.1 Protein of unknown function [Chitinophaga costaii]
MYLYFIPLLGAFIGWFTNWATIRLLFRPLRPVNLGFIKLQGIFPKYQQQWAQLLGDTVATQLFSFDAIRTKLTDPEQIKAIMPVVESHLDTFLREKLPKAMPVLSMFIGDSTVSQIKGVLVEELHHLFPLLIGQYVNNLERDINIQQMVATRISTLSATELEAALHARLRKPLQALLWLGAGIGFVIGIVQLAIVLA